MTDSPDWVVSTRNEIGELPDLPEGRAIDRTMLPLLAAGFVDALRRAGVEVPIGATLLYVRALSAVNRLDRSARYWCGRTTLITRPEDFMTYHRVFGRYWAGAEFADEPDGLTVTTKVAVEEHDDEGVEGEDDSAGDADGDPDVVMRYSAVEVLRDKDFADYTKEELLELSHLKRYRGLGHVQCFGSLGEAQQLGYGMEYLESAITHSVQRPSYRVQNYILKF